MPDALPRLAPGRQRLAAEIDLRIMEGIQMMLEAEPEHLDLETILWLVRWSYVQGAFDQYRDGFTVTRLKAANGVGGI